MILNRISVLNYRNLAQVELEFSPKVNCLVGGNGQGKTNLLDAIHFLSLCKSMSGAPDAANIRHDEECFVLQGMYTHENGECEEVTCGLQRGQRKRLRRNRKEYRKLSEHIGLLPIVVVSPSDTGLVTGGSEERRHFMDMVIAQYNREYLESLVRYNKALQQRGTLLKQPQEPDAELMELWEGVMAAEGERIYQARKQYVEEFTPIFASLYADIAGSTEQVGLCYKSHGERGDLAAQLRQSREKDRIVGYSLHGVHRDDLEFTLGGFALRREGSQGQLKTYLTSLKLAQFGFLRHTGSHTLPLLLLDDVFDKLDADRVGRIVKLVGGDRFGQIFITHTSRSQLDGILQAYGGDYKVFAVEEGRIMP